MKKIIALMAALMLFCTSFAFAEVDLTGLTDDELRGVIADAQNMLSFAEHTEEGFVIEFEEYGVKLVITGWEAQEYYGEDTGIEFSCTVYNESDMDIEICISNTTVNGWLVLDSGFYTSVVEIPAGQKTRDTFQINSLTEKAGLSGADEVENIVCNIYLREADNWSGEYMGERELIILDSDLAMIPRAE